MHHEEREVHAEQKSLLSFVVFVRFVVNPLVPCVCTYPYFAVMNSTFRFLAVLDWNLLRPRTFQRKSAVV
jgi:hypothetical protein